MLSADQLKRIHNDAKDVVNGFRTVRQQQARDVLELVALVAEMQHANEILMRKLEQQAPERHADEPSFTEAFNDVFGSIFGKKKD